MSTTRLVGRMIRRAQEARKSADANLSTGLFNLACISAYQFVQLMIKARIIERTKTEPRAKGLMELLKALGEALDRREEVAKFLEELKEEIEFVEELYRRSRKDPSSCTREEVERLVMIVDSIVDFVEEMVERAGPA
ncbi:MAG TPA: HEPN domain-containing protein [Candidatus Bathyarchaeota archaeon]|nr:HEPN domain-containing protein [Candidatus Bathyarchaeota archaeon]